MALTLDEASGRFAGLALNLFLLLSNPTQLGDRVRSSDVDPRRFRCYQRYPAMGRMYGQVDVLDVLLGHQNRNFSELDSRAHQ
jgi:hypothetical protein